MIRIRWHGICLFSLERIQKENDMKTMMICCSLLVIIMFFGCNERIFQPDITPPAMPQGLSTATGDNVIEIFWNNNSEPDLAGYDVFVSDKYDGKYTLIGTTTQTHFIDKDSRNGKTYYYAVSAFDADGNESVLSHDVAYDTPRPEGYNIVLKDYRTAPDVAGYDFSTYSVGPYDDKYTDLFFENYNGKFYLNVWTDSDIQDMGYTTSLYDITDAPTKGWSPTKDAQAIAGHTYILWTWDDHYAKVRINSITSGRIDFDWAYQLQSGNTRLKTIIKTERGIHTLGDGVKSRQ